MKNRIDEETFGTSYLKLFYWLAIILIAILINKGIETFIIVESFRETFVNFRVPIDSTGIGNTFCLILYSIDWYKIADFVLDLTILFLIILFILRYIIWSPYKIFSNVEEFDNEGDSLYKTLEDRIIFEINQSTLKDCILSFLVFIIEFILAYLAVVSYENHKLLILLLFLLSGLDILIAFVIPLWFTAKNSSGNLRQAYRAFFGRKTSRVKAKVIWRNVFLTWREFFEYIRPSIADLTIMVSIGAIITFLNLMPEKSKLHQVESSVIIILGLFGSILISYKFHIKKKYYYQKIFYILKLSNSFEDYENDIPAPYKKKLQDFAGKSFQVNPHCYIPTPETEHLLTKVKEHIKELNKTNPFILDIGTGCGNLAISLKSEFNDAEIIGTDISNRAIGMAFTNASNLDKDVEFIACNLVASNHINKQPDLIIANLPWGNSEPNHILPSNKRYVYNFNPMESLFPETGLIGTYVSLIKEIKQKNWKTTLFFEVGTLSEDEVKQEITKELLSEVNASFDYIRIVENENNDNQQGKNQDNRGDNNQENGNPNDENGSYSIVKMTFK